MIPRRASISLIVGILAVVFATSLRASVLPTLSIRYMTIEADVIVVGEPVEPREGVLPTKYKVSSVVKGPDSLVGQEIVLIDQDLYSLSPSPWGTDDKTGKTSPRISKALLFLRYSQGKQAQEGYRTVSSGIRALTENGTVLVPQQIMNPGPQYLLPMKGMTWDGMLAQVREDLPRIARILELGQIADQGERNRAIFTWIENHRDEFGGGYFEGQEKGWAPLEQRLFDWIMESCIAEDCWKAIQLSSALGLGPQENHPSFCSQEGRELLLAKVTDRKLSEASRLMALRQLGSGITFWYAHRDLYPRTRVITRGEQKVIIDHVLPLLKHEDASWRAAGVRCLMSVSWPYDANFKEMIDKRGVPDLVALYRGERNAEVREEVVQAIRRIEDESFWEKLSGNPEGIVVLLRCSGLKQDVMEFHLNLEYTRATITETPVFRFQELREDGSVIQSRLVEPAIGYPRDLFTKGWKDWQGMITMTVPARQLTPGLWRVSVEGSLGDHTWHSEPIEITISDKAKDE